MKKIVPLFILVFVIFSTYSFAQVDARMLQYPDVSQTQITFYYGGDLWVVSKEGGIANKLTNAKGEEILPRFSPDGKQIAFSGNYNGNVDIYVVPSMGGMAQRVTHHGMFDRMDDWYPDGSKILYTSSMESGKQRFNQFYSVSPQGGMPDKLPLPYGEFGSLSPDGKMIAYTPITTSFRTWKRYRGGMAPDIWIFNLETKASENITNDPANDEFPMWYKNTIYFMSDRNTQQRSNIYAYDVSTKQIRQVTDFKDYDTHFPSMGPSDIVFENGGKLYLLDLASEKYHEVKVDVVTDESTLLPHAENVSKLIQSFVLSPDAKRGVFEARGDVFSVPAENGPVIDLTNTSGYAERYPSWSPDGKYIAYWSDKSGEYELTLKDLEKPESEKKLTSYGPGYRYQLYWSPDSKQIAFIDKAMVIYIYNVDKDKTIQVDKEKNMYEGNLQSFAVSWSPDGRWIAYQKDTENNHTAISLFDTKDEKVYQVTSGYYNDMQPVFDPDGKYLFFLTNRNFNPVYSDIDNSFVYPNSTNIAAVSLDKDTLSPMAPKNDVVEIKKEDEKKKDEDKKDEDKKEEKSKETSITLNGFEERIVILPPEGGNYTGLQTVKGKIIYMKLPRSGSSDQKRSIMYYDLDKREEKTVVADINNFAVSADGKKLLVAKDGSFFVIDISPDQKLEKKMPTDQMEMTVVPREEWKQIFNDTWRFERDFFYDPNMHGVDWNAMREHYGKLIDYAVTRWDVNYIIGELISELNSSHTYRGGGDAEEAPSRPVGYLGIDWQLDNGAYKIKKIIRGAQWDSEVRSPLDAPGVNVKEGDYILAVNGIPLDITKDPWAAFEGLAGKTIQLTVNSKPEMDGSHKVVVETLKDETRLRNLAWIESNRKYVDEKTNGKIGYIYVPDTGVNGQTELERQFNAQFNKQGLVIDERFNNGGQVPDRFIELLNRKPLAFFAVRDGVNWQWPPVANFGPKVMLINGWSGSGGDAFPDFFRRAALGPLVGMRTWGGLIGISGSPALIDGGGLTVPTFRQYNPDGTWFLEGHGVDPDIQVVDDPTQLANGVDPQLEKGVETVMDMLQKNPPVHPQQPAYQNRSVTAQ
ncbi:MAG TPA: PDZ domain-containing protein [Ignavibacteriaceae bacterium]|nr:PDZ domain-containing protein [Ignavibacteriaceae bacterium]